MQKFEEKVREEAGITLELDSVIALRENEEGGVCGRDCLCTKFFGPGCHHHLRSASTVAGGAS